MRLAIVLCVGTACGRVGFDPQVATSDAGREDEQPGMWRTTESVPRGYRLGCGVGFAGHVYSIGGFADSTEAVADVNVARVGAQGLLEPWRASTPLPTPTWWHACAVDPASRTIYVTGGDDGALSRDTVVRATIAEDGSVGAWTSERALPDLRRGHGAFVANGSLCIAGGERSEGFVVHAEVYCAAIAADGALGPWVERTPMPRADYMFGVTEVAGSVFVTGGHFADGAVVSGPSGGALMPTTTLPGPRERHAAVTVGGYLYVAGGETIFDGPNLATVLRAPIQGTQLGAWEERAVLPMAIAYMAAAVVDDRIYIISGSDGVNSHPTVYVMTP